MLGRLWTVVKAAPYRQQPGCKARAWVDFAPANADVQPASRTMTCSAFQPRGAHSRAQPVERRKIHRSPITRGASPKTRDLRAIDMDRLGAFGAYLRVLVDPIYRF